jgi:hypothetical protein
MKRKLKVGDAVRAKGTLGIIEGWYPFAKKWRVILLSNIHSNRLFHDWEFVPLPNVFINNLGKAVMKARIAGHQHEIGIYLQINHEDRWICLASYSTKQGARKALKRWADKYGVNVEIVK